MLLLTITHLTGQLLRLLSQRNGLNKAKREGYTIKTLHESASVIMKNNICPK